MISVPSHHSLSQAKPRILWFTSRPAPAVIQKLHRSAKGSGYWINSLLEALRPRANVRLGVATIRTGTGDLAFEQDGIEYFVIDRPRLLGELTWRDQLRRCVELARQWQPDLIHVHGTETLYGLVGPRVDCPTVISLQGLLSVYQRQFWGTLSMREILAAHSLTEVLRGAGLFWEWRRQGRNAVRESEILRQARHVLGRTLWDRAHAAELAPQARYSWVGEILRPTFYGEPWQLDSVERDSVIFTNAGSPRRGVETALEAAALVRRGRPRLGVKLGGDLRGAYGAFIRRKARQLGLEVECLGYLDDEMMRRRLLQSHVFVLPSYLENSSNSLAEAMLVGMPCVASCGGGTPSMIDDGRTGLMFSPGDAAVLAQRIEMLLCDDELAVSLAQAARAQALMRHDPDRVVDQLLGAYESAMGRRLRHQEVIR